MAVPACLLCGLGLAGPRRAEGHPGHGTPRKATVAPAAQPPAAPVIESGPPAEPLWLTPADFWSLAQAEPDPVQKRDAQSPAGDPAMVMARAFAPFVERKEVQIRQDDRWLYVESHGLPQHPLMIGIRAWQQQVPLPQNYTGGNAWQIPLHPVPARNPRSARNDFLRGAIAVAVNGIPIFNPLTNRGADAYLGGELDDWGGHCGRADDYHYHLAPVHLEEVVGRGRPIAYALDGYPIYGYTEPDGSAVKNLDEFNGHTDGAGQYHYHATRKYPYLNGGFHGEVVSREGQVEPQSRAEPVRPDLRPLKGARIVDFQRESATHFVLTYELAGRRHQIDYTVKSGGAVAFQFIDPDGRVVEETHQPRRRREDRPGRGGPKAGSNRDPEPPPRRGGERPPRPDENRPPGDRPPADRPPENRPPENRPPENRPSAQRDRSERPQDPPPGSEPRGRPRGRPPEDRPPPPQHKSVGDVRLSSSSVNERGVLSVDCSCDGKAQSPALEWRGLPEGTVSLAVSLWHIAPDQEKSYWVLYNIPADAERLVAGVTDLGTVGTNGRRKVGYDPLCSQGPGQKTYHITLFALSKKLTLTPAQATREGLLKAVEGSVLAEQTLDVIYERPRSR